MAAKEGKYDTFSETTLLPLSNVDTGMRNNSWECLEWVAHVPEQTGLLLWPPLCILAVVIGKLQTKLNETKMPAGYLFTISVF
jgi:hypothetical protein